MAMKHFKAYTPSRRNMTTSTYEEVTKKTPEKSLTTSLKK
jgi:large subunit ribosomal protein L2